MKPAPDWTTSQMLRARLQQWWDSGRLLAERVRGVNAFPLELSLRAPTTAQLGERFDEARSWVRELEAGSRAAIGHGYDIVWCEINHRQLGRNRIPDKVVIPTAEDAFRWLGRAGAVRRFDALLHTSVAAFSPLIDWIARRPLVLLDRADEWERVLACLQWFARHPRAQLYVRQLDIPGVDSKFIESRKALLSELLDLVLPDDAIFKEAAGVRQFELRYGLRAKPPTLRFRVLDPAFAIAGLTDLSVPAEQFAALYLPVERVFVTENEINGLAFPPASAAMVVFGGGYAVERLGDIAWLREREIVYWGDIDTHGFAILDRLRAGLPHVRSLMMDDATLHAHATLWGQEDADKRFVGDLTRLTAAEAALFAELCGDRYGARVRLEQERIAYGWVEDAVRAIC